jgi:hypothetical protein
LPTLFFAGKKSTFEKMKFRRDILKNSKSNYTLAGQSRCQKQSSNGIAYKKTWAPFFF